LEIVSDTNTNKHVVEKYAYPIVKAAIAYVYSGQATLRDDNVYELLTFADKYGMDELRNSCFDYLVKTLDKNTVAPMVMKAKTGGFDFDSAELVKKCIAFIEKKTQDVLEAPEFLLFDEDMVISILQSDKITGDEIDVYKAAIKWGKSHCKDKVLYTDLKEVLQNVMKHIRYPLIDAKDLIETVRHDGFMPRELYVWALEYNASPESFKFSSIPSFKERAKCFFGGSLLSAGHSSQLFRFLSQAKCDSAKKQWKVIYKASKDGFASTTFHQKCDNQGETITVIKASNGYLFGGYNPQSWTSNSVYTNDGKTFLFSLVGAKGQQPTLCPTISGKGNSTYGCSTYGPTWGGGHDLYLVSGCDKSSGSYSNLGYSFSAPGLTYNTQPCKDFLAGSYNFMVTEIEVYKIK
jgi:hypothetical protein